MLENLSGALQNGLSVVLTFVPRLALFLVIMLIGWLVAKALRKLVDAVLERVGFDRVVERGGVGAALSRSTYDASDLIAALVYYAVLLVTLQLAFGVFGPNPVSDLIAGIVAFLPQLVVAIIIVIVASAIAAAVKDLVMGVMGGLSYGRLLGTIASVFIVGLGVIAALNQVGIATTVTLPVLVTVLATVGGILVVGVGGGLIGPMRSRWEGWLSAAEQEAPGARAHAQAFERGREDAARAAAPDPAAPTPAEGIPAQGSSDRTAH